jgi:acyl-CoA synthetase (AMP-forming)/AMP-acid ligase II
VKIRIMASPISPAGKILKRELREIVAQRLALEQTR